MQINNINQSISAYKQSQIYNKYQQKNIIQSHPSFGKLLQIHKYPLGSKVLQATFSEIGERISSLPPVKLFFEYFDGNLIVKCKRWGGEDVYAADIEVDKYLSYKNLPEVFLEEYQRFRVEPDNDLVNTPIQIPVHARVKEFCRVGMSSRYSNDNSFTRLDEESVDVLEELREHYIDKFNMALRNRLSNIQGDINNKLIKNGKKTINIFIDETMSILKRKASEYEYLRGRQEKVDAMRPKTRSSLKPIETPPYTRSSILEGKQFGYPYYEDTPSMAEREYYRQRMETAFDNLED